MEEIIINEARTKDLPLVEEIFKDEVYKFTRDRTSIKLQNPNWKILLARYNGEIAGIITMTTIKYSPWVRSIDVVQVIEWFRRNWIARALVQWIEALVVLENKHLFLWAKVAPIYKRDPSGKETREENMASKNLLLSEGFTYDSMDATYYKRIN